MLSTRSVESAECFQILGRSRARIADNYLLSVQNINWSSREAAMANKGQLVKKVQG
jgi:hypothetical protein